jgi:transcriptional regulator GlxA family with amidase domain
MPQRIALLLFPDAEVLDFAGPFEVFAVANELRGGRAFEISIVGLDASPVRARHGFTVLPDHTLATCPPAELLIIPGGRGARALLRQPDVLAWVQARAARAEIVFSICTGSLILAQAGLLDGLTVTTHHTALDFLADLAPHATIDASKRFHDNGKIVTAAGISAGIDAAIHLVARLLGPEAAQDTLREMEYTLQK